MPFKDLYRLKKKAMLYRLRSLPGLLYHASRLRVAWWVIGFSTSVGGWRNLDLDTLQLIGFVLYSFWPAIPC